MYGIEAINANNGWAISIVGISIVFSGLVLLSIVISQLHKVLDIWENPQKINIFKKKTIEKPQSPSITVFTETQKEDSKQFHLLVKTLEDNFSLPKLLSLAKVSGLENTHSTLGILLKAEIILPDKEGYFLWNEEKFDKVISY